MIGAHIGTAIGSPGPRGQAQSVSASMTGAASFVRLTGKSIPATMTGTVAIPRSIAFSIVVASTLTAAITRLTAKPVRAAATASGKVIKAVFTSTVAARMTALVSFLGFPRIVSRVILHNPVDFVLASAQRVRAKGREWFIPEKNTREQSRAMRTAVRRHGPKPSFTTRTDNKGYD